MDHTINKCGKWVTCQFAYLAWTFSSMYPSIAGNTRIGCLVLAQLWHRVVLVSAVDKEQTRLASSVSTLNNQVEHIAGTRFRRLARLYQHLAGHWVLDTSAASNVWIATAWVDQIIGGVVSDSLHKHIGDRNTDIKVGNLAAVLLHRDKLKTIRVFVPQDTHVSASHLLPAFAGLGHFCLALSLSV